MCDFYCPQARLVVELDGASHRTSTGSQHDAKRDQWLCERDYFVLRISNADVVYRLDQVLARIALALTPALSRKRERGLTRTDAADRVDLVDANQDANGVRRGVPAR